MATTLVSSAGGMLYSIIRVPLSLISLISLSLSSLGKLDNTTIIAHHHKNSKVIRGNSVVIIEMMLSRMEAGKKGGGVNDNEKNDIYWFPVII
ncbi:uncharacterized protein LOC114423134 isoform X3 [Glycine soja]|uniref:uncharacterized protein LOC114423134 isoform X3 n=1 Tax=Glycine soja TaxID=3848 RepID=UPI00103C97A2|nr:uncharacterized protein LOC114423134 isoform X3 [Glycine soja]